MSPKTRENTHFFFGGISRISRGHPKSLRKNVCVQFLPPCLNLHEVRTLLERQVFVMRFSSKAPGLSARRKTLRCPNRYDFKSSPLAIANRIDSKHGDVSCDFYPLVHRCRGDFGCDFAGALRSLGKEKSMTLIFSRGERVRSHIF